MLGTLLSGPILTPKYFMPSVKATDATEKNYFIDVLDQSIGLFASQKQLPSEGWAERAIQPGRYF